MDIVLIANGLTNEGEHSYRLIQEVCRVLDRRSIGCHVYAARSLDPGIVAEGIAEPHFTYSLYDSIGPLAFKRLAHGLESRWLPGGAALFDILEAVTWRLLNRSFRRDLASLPRELCSPDHLLVITAISQNQISGLVDFMCSRPQALLPNVVCQLMFAPDWTPWGRGAHLGAAYYREAFQRAAPFVDGKLFFTTENDAIARIYREQYGLETKILPIPFAVACPPRRAERTVHLGFFGYSKSEKGFHLLSEAAAICQAEGLDVEFHIQIQHSHWEHAVVEAERKLRAMPNICLIEGTLSSDDYVAETNKVDVMLLPYDPASFGMRGSGIFTESVAAGRPVIAAEGTFAAHCIERGEAQGESFAPYDARALADAIARLLPRLSECNLRAAEKAEAFARAHSGEAYVDVLLGFAEMSRSHT
jgi:glycosyltransferase involved in cell wall biosynthesis